MIYGSSQNPAKSKERICSGQWSVELEEILSSSGQTVWGENAENQLWNFSFVAGIIHMYVTISWKVKSSVLFL